MTRAEILSKINKIIKEEHGNEVTEDNIITDCGIDSFGYAILWIGLENDIIDKPEDIVLFPKEYYESDYSLLTFKKLIDRVEEVQNVYK